MTKSGDGNHVEVREVEFPLGLHFMMTVGSRFPSPSLDPAFGDLRVQR